MNQYVKSPAGSLPAKLGEILVQHGSLKSRDLSHALDLQKHRDARLGDILIAHKFSTPAAVRSALRAQISGELLNITSTAPDPELIHGLDPKTCIRLQALPWRRVGHTILIAAADHTRFDEIAAEWPGRISLIHADVEEIHQSIEAIFSAKLTREAAALCPDQYSCRKLDLVPKKTKTAATIGVIIGLAAASPDIAFMVLFLWALLSNFATTALRLTALVSFIKPLPKMQSSSTVSLLADHRKRPRVSVLIPLFREERVIPALLAAMGKLTYPKEMLDIKILLEEHDDITRIAANQTARHELCAAFLHREHYRDL